jgi:hypothetical protein
MNTTLVSQKIEYIDYFLTPSESYDSYKILSIAFFKKCCYIGILSNTFKTSYKIYLPHKTLPILTLDGLRKIFKIFPKFYSINEVPNKNKLILVTYKVNSSSNEDVACFKTNKKGFYTSITSNAYLMHTNLILPFAKEAKIIQWCYYHDLYNFLLEFKR